MSSQTLYRFWNEDDELLYVGITVRPWDRWKQHAGEKPWWEEVAKVTIENYATRDEVKAAETLAIKTEGPRYNIAEMPKETIRSDVEDDDWDGVHVPVVACIGSLVWCSCRTPDWDSMPSIPRKETVTFIDPESGRKMGRIDPDTGLVDRAYRVSEEVVQASIDQKDSWIKANLMEASEFGAHVIEATLGESFSVRTHAPKKVAARRPSVKFVKDAWPTAWHHLLPRSWQTYAREWLDQGATRAEVREAMEIAGDAYSSGRTDRPWVYAGGVIRRMVAEREGD